ncbi:MAG: Uncharacterised protein [Glaciecola sp. HTCC2999]|jgi:hypothetical protein|nr:MAG: Uncharacterised protein [Glaciecola sp. HTCC2999]
MSILATAPIIGGLINQISSSIDDLVTSDEERGHIDIEKKQIELKRLTAELKEQHMQLQINMAQAKHPSIFVAGARPAIIWIGALGLAYEALLRPIGSWMIMLNLDMDAILGDAAFQNATNEQIETVSHFYMLPSMNTELFMPIILGILGIGGYRTWEKLKGKARDNLQPQASEIPAHQINR